MIKSTSVLTFIVTNGKHRLRVKAFSTIRDVHREYTATRSDGWHISREGKWIYAFFYPAAVSTISFAGTIVLPLNGNLEDFVPHEVAHAVFDFFGEVHKDDDEDAATAIGKFTCKILKKLQVYRT